jgi:hypothetical protein
VKKAWLFYAAACTGLILGGLTVSSKAPEAVQGVMLSVFLMAASLVCIWSVARR